MAYLNILESLMISGVVLSKVEKFVNRIVPCLFGATETTTVGVSAVVNEQSRRLGLWQGRCSVQRGVPAGAALTRTSLSIPVDLRGRSAGLRRGSLLRRLTRLVTRGLMLGWLAGCGAAEMMVVVVGGG